MAKIFGLIICLIVAACGDSGGYQQQQPYPQPTPTPTPTPTPQPGLSWAQMQQILNSNCARCHAGAGFLNNEPVFLNNAAARIKNNSMPPPNSREAQSFQGVRPQVLQYIQSRGG